jgi:hypothetical protein
MQKILCSEIQPLPRPLQANSTKSPPLPLVSQWSFLVNTFCFLLEKKRSFEYYLVNSKEARPFYSTLLATRYNLVRSFPCFSCS